MDLILISDLTKKLSSIFLYKKKSDIQSFIEDPLSLDLTHLENVIKLKKVLVGGDGLSNALTSVAGTAAGNGTVTEAPAPPAKDAPVTPEPAAAEPAAPEPAAPVAPEPAKAGVAANNDDESSDEDGDGDGG